MTTRAERVAAVAELDERLGRRALQREVAEELGISRSYAAALRNDPTGDGDRDRKRSYDGVCESCGGATSGSEGPAKVPRVCKDCNSRFYLLVWTPETVIDAIRRFAAEHGRPPVATDWTRSDPEKNYPAATSVYFSNNGKLNPAFDSWADAIEAAGFPRPGQGHRTYKEGEIAMGESRITREYLVLSVSRNGSNKDVLSVIAIVEATTNLEALDKADLDQEGEYASIPVSSLQRFHLKSRMVAERQRPRA